MRSFLEAEAAEKRRIEKEEHSVEAYESKFKRIQEISGEPSLEKLVDKFIEGLSDQVRWRGKESTSLSSSRRQELRSLQLRQRAEQSNRNSARTDRRYQQGDSPLRKPRR